ncbi:MAG TPA: glycerophosphodiester phosphodiesterase [Longimicrobiales bacterium]
MKRRVLLPLAGVLAGGAVGLRRGRRDALSGRALHPVLAGGPLVIAHRGGAALAPENTLPAFEQAVAEWSADMIELDVHATADGRCVVMHDPTVDRTTEGTGRVAELSLAEIRRLDAGYRFTPDGGRSYPYRDRGVRVPTIEEVLEAFPTTRLTIEVKAAAAQRPLFEAIRRAGAAHRVIAAGQYEAWRTLFPTFPGPTSPSTERFRRFFILHRLGLGALWAPPGDVVQLPDVWEGRRIVTPRLVRDLHAHGKAVHVWTIDETEDMRRLLDWGVDGVVTDRPDRLVAVLRERGFRGPAGSTAVEPVE